MKTFHCIAIVCTLGLLAGVSLADKILLKDGTTREGVILDQDSTEIHVRIDNGGLAATITIPMSNVAGIEKGPVKPATPPTPPPQPAPTSPPATPPASQHATVSVAPIPSPAAGTNPVTTTGATSLPPTRGFFTELLASAAGNGPGNLSRLPQNLQDLWKDAQQQDAAGKKAAELEALRKLEEAFRNANALPRLDGLCVKERQQPFGLWMATVHFAVMSDNYHTGMFDITDIRDIEKQPLIGLMKEKTPEALDPLKTYFPPINDKTGKPEPFKPAQLQGITVDNALDLKDKAQFAHALVFAQIRLDPQMPVADRTLLYGQLNNVTHIVTRCSELEPAAKAKAKTQH